MNVFIRWVGIAPLLMISLAWAQTDTAPDVDEIVHRANHVAYFLGKDGRAQVQMLITDNQGRKRQRSFTILRRDDSDSESIDDRGYLGEQKLYVYFHRPSDVNKMVFLVHKKTDLNPVFRTLGTRWARKCSQNPMCPQ